MKYLLFLCFLIMGCAAYAQENTWPDLSKFDVTASKDFDGAKATFRGLRLGMSKVEAIAALKKMTDYTWYFDSFNTKSEDPASKEQMRIYVNLKKVKGVEDPAVLYLQWVDDKEGMQAMVFYRALLPSMKGDTKKLFSKEALKAACTCRKFLRGAPVKEVDNIGITTFTFADQHFQLISMGEKGKEDVWFKLLL